MMIFMGFPQKLALTKTLRELENHHVSQYISNSMGHVFRESEGYPLVMSTVSYWNWPIEIVSFPIKNRWRMVIYPLVNIQKAIEHGPFIVDLPIKNGDLP